ncbi:MAG: hypothetical protein JRI68_23080 [Deltaproteobacteria bacterium]|nr:hypothetical protein [Deltaproteobacteria bacterium]
MQLHKLLMAAAMGCTVILVGGSAASGPQCDKATAETKRAQAVLSQAVRDSDGKAAAYFACMERSGHKRTSCAAQKRALDQATAHKRRAQEAYRFAKARQAQACR